MPIGVSPEPTKEKEVAASGLLQPPVSPERRREATGQRHSQDSITGPRNASLILAVSSLIIVPFTHDFRCGHIGKKTTGDIKAKSDSSMAGMLELPNSLKPS